MSNDTSALILLIGVVAVAMVSGIYLGLRERRSASTPALTPQGMTVLYWSCGTVQLIAFALVVAAWQQVIPAAWGQVGAALAFSTQLLLSFAERRRGMIMLNLLIGLILLLSVL